MKFKSLLAFLAIAATVAGCGDSEKDDNGGTPVNLDVKIQVTPNPCKTGEEVSFSSEVTGGTGKYTYAWYIGEDQISDQGNFTRVMEEHKGTYTVKLVVTDNKNGEGERKKTLVVNPSEAPETENVTINWVGQIGGYPRGSVAAVANDGSVYATCNNGKLIKFDKNGGLVWEVMFNEKSAVGGITVDADGTVYICGGDGGGNGKLTAYSPDGKELWSFSEWFAENYPEAKTPAPEVTNVTTAIDGDVIYLGNTGTSGTAIAIDKKTGSKIKHAGKILDGYDFGTPGGSRSNLAVSGAGTVHWFGGQWGIFGVKQEQFSADNKNKMAAYSSLWSDSNSLDFAPAGTYNLGYIATTTIGDKTYVCGQKLDKRAPAFSVYAVNVDDMSDIVQVYIEETAQSQNQGGVVITADHKIVCGLKSDPGLANGGVALIDIESGEIYSRYDAEVNVSGSPAIDAAGNIHFASENGWYYVVAPNGKGFKNIAKLNLTSYINSKASFTNMKTAKMWSSPVIGDDGKIYVEFVNNETRSEGGVVCFSIEGVTGPGATDWPMFGHDRRHTGNQKNQTL